jgi:hypothetical protein
MLSLARLHQRVPSLEAANQAMDEVFRDWLDDEVSIFAEDIETGTLLDS